MSIKPLAFYDLHIITRFTCIVFLNCRRALVFYTGSSERAIMRNDVHCHQHKQGDDVLHGLSYSKRVSILYASQIRSGIFQFICRQIQLEETYPIQQRS